MDELKLQGWDWRSVWGFDNHHRSCFAGLWRNGSRALVLDICLSGGHARSYWWPGCIALELLAITGHGPTTVVRATPSITRLPSRCGSRPFDRSDDGRRPRTARPIPLTIAPGACEFAYSGGHVPVTEADEEMFADVLDRCRDVPWILEHGHQNAASPS